MTASTIDHAELEDRVRTALAVRARSTVVDVPERFATEGGLRPFAPRPSRRALVAVAAAVVVAVLGLAALALRDDGDAGPVTGESPEGGISAPGIPIQGPTGSRWFVLALPGGVTPDGSSRTPTPATPGGRPELQAFRTDAGFDGPAVWIESDVASVGQGSPEASRVTVQGETAYLHRSGDVVRLGWPGPGGDGSGGYYVVAVHLSDDDVVALGEGLRPRAGGGWDATVLPGGLTEVTEDAPARPPSEHVEWEYEGPDGAHYEVFVNPGGAAELESWAREHAVNGGAVEAISVDGRPGMVVTGSGGESVAVWRPTDDVVVDFRTSLDRDGLLAALEALLPVDEAAWAEQFATPPEPGA